MPSGGRRVRFGDKCKDCNVELTKFNTIRKGSLEYLQPRCKSCYIKRRDGAPSRTKEARSKQYIEWKWGLTFDEYSKMSESQLHGCAICRKPCNVRRRLAVDHSHKTGKIRSLLCHRCNTILGLCEENDGLLHDIIDYIKKFNTKLSA